MWLTDLIISAAEEVPAAPPEIPFESIGVILVAMVTGITAVIVALIQRGKNRPEPPQTGTAPASSVFVVSKDDWDKVRESVTRMDALLLQFRNDYDYHERMMLGEVRDLDNEISRIKGHLGMS